MNEVRISSPLTRSKMILHSTPKSTQELLNEEQQEVLKEEIYKSRCYLQQSNTQHDLRIKDIRISYEIKLQQVKNECEQEIKHLQDKI